MLKKTKKLANTADRKLVAKFSPKSPISEQYRTIRTNIQFASVDKEMRSILVTSAGPGEGKSTTVANLAIVFAQQGKKVLLIDGDLRKPTVHYTFNVANNVGLTNVLTKQMEFDAAIVDTDEQNLYVLSSGPVPPNPAELLGSKTMVELIDKACEEFDIVLIDTPPILAVTDAHILANVCDGTLLVVSSGKTVQESAIKAKELLISSSTKLLGAVLNDKKANYDSYHYYYGNK